jgi:hypothetical protein
MMISVEKSFPVLFLSDTPTYLISDEYLCLLWSAIYSAVTLVIAVTPISTTTSTLESLPSTPRFIPDKVTCILLLDFSF